MKTRKPHPPASVELTATVEGYGYAVSHRRVAKTMAEVSQELGKLYNQILTSGVPGQPKVKRRKRREAGNYRGGSSA